MRGAQGQGGRVSVPTRGRPGWSQGPEKPENRKQQKGRRGRRTKGGWIFGGDGERNIKSIGRRGKASDNGGRGEGWIRGQTGRGEERM